VGEIRFFYFLFIRFILMRIFLWRRGSVMAENPESICEWLEIDLNRLTADDKMGLIEEIFDALTVPELRRMSDLAELKSQEKLEDAKNEVLAEMKGKLEELGLSFDEVMGVNRGRRRRGGKSTLPPRYRDSEGREWSGRGNPPAWIRDYEEAGGNREDYLIKDEA